MSLVVIIDYGAGNLNSIAKACELKSNPLGMNVVISDQASALQQASHIILPGVGAFADCMSGLKAVPGMLDAMERAVLNQKKPFLGICVGMQMLASKGEEHGNHKGLGWIKGDVIEIANENNSLRIPHMGWNTLTIKKQHPVFTGINNGDHVYFVHSYHFKCQGEESVIATTSYGQHLNAAIAQDNIIGVQFHPEKSQETGCKLIHNFLSMS